MAYTGAWEGWFQTSEIELLQKLNCTQVESRRERRQHKGHKRGPFFLTEAAIYSNLTQNLRKMLKQLKHSSPERAKEAMTRPQLSPSSLLYDPSKGLVNSRTSTSPNPLYLKKFLPHYLSTFLMRKALRRVWDRGGHTIPKTAHVHHAFLRENRLTFLWELGCGISMKLQFIVL